jgi:hypothetical protein
VKKFAYSLSSLATRVGWSRDKSWLVIDVYYIEIFLFNSSQPSQQHSSTQRLANIQPTANNDGRGYQGIVEDIKGKF